MRKTSLIFFIFLLINTGYLQAQKKGYSEGYVVTLQNDTIHGLIKSKNRVASCRSVSFISDSGDKQKYTPREIKFYSKTRKIYRSFLLPDNILGAHAFMKELVKGKINLYIHYRTQQNSGMTANGQQAYGSSTTVETFYLGRGDSKELVRVSQLDFKAQLSELVKDNDELSAMILNKEYRYDDIEEIIEIYNEG